MRTCFFISCLTEGVGTTPLHANERGQTVRFVAVIEPPVYWGISIGLNSKTYIVICLSFYLLRNNRIRFQLEVEPVHKSII